MSILITGIDMPTKGNPITVLIYPDGMAEWEAQNKAGIAVPVPPHGRLGDLDTLYSELAKRKSYGELSAKSALRAVANAPTIIPASEEGET